MPTDAEIDELVDKIWNTSNIDKHREIVRDWFRSQVREVELKGELVKLAEALNNPRYPYDPKTEVDDYLSTRRRGKMIRGNKYEFKVGDTVMLDESFNNAVEVEIISFTEPSELFATVKLLGKSEKWDVMTNRLTPLTEKK